MKPSPARAEPHDATAWLPLPEVEDLPSVEYLLTPDPEIEPTAARDVPVGMPSPARSEPHDATTWLPLPEVDELPPIDDLLVPDPDVLPDKPREVPIALPSPARAEPHDATAWLPIPDLAERTTEPRPEPEPTKRRRHRGPRARIHLPWRSIALALAATIVVGGGYFGVERLLDQPDIEVRVDGDLVSAETGAATVAAVLVERGIELGEHDEVVPPPDTPVKDKLRIDVLRGFPVRVNYDGNAATVHTTHSSPELFLADAVEALSLPDDVAVRDAPERIKEGDVVQLRTMKSGTLIVDGPPITFNAPVFQVRELLDDYDIELGPEDYTIPVGVDEPVPDGEPISVVRVGQFTVQEDEAYTLPPVTMGDPELPVEVTNHVVEGTPGVLRVTYALVFNNGIVVERTPISKVPVVEAVPTITYFGTRYDPRWDKMAQCETGGNWDATGLKYQGGLGIYFQNWNHYGGRKFAPTGGQATKYEQIIVAERIRDEHGWGAWGCNDRLRFSN